MSDVKRTYVRSVTVGYPAFLPERIESKLQMWLKSLMKSWCKNLTRKGKGLVRPILILSRY